jgi:hypothetical protein
LRVQQKLGYPQTHGTRIPRKNKIINQWSNTQVQEFQPKHVIPEKTQEPINEKYSETDLQRVGITWEG